MNRFLALLLAALLCASPAFAAITPTAIGNNNSAGSTVSSLTISTTADSPAGNPIIEVTAGTSGTALSTADSKNNSYTTETRFVAAGFGILWLSHADNPVDLPAPCTVTATETSTTLVITAAITCPSADTFGSGTVTTETISGGSFTGSFALNTPCLLVAGAATCTITGGATVAAPATATITSTIKASWTTATKAVMAAISWSGLATTSTLDVLGTGNTTGSPGTTFSAAVTTLTIGDLVIGRLDASGTWGSPTLGGTGTWIPLTSILSAGNNTINWAYQVIPNASTVTFSGTGMTSRNFGVIEYAFKPAGAASVTPHQLLLGVGP